MLQFLVLAPAFSAPLKVCPLCNREIPPELESRHHLVPKLKGGKTSDANIVVLHRPCHDKVHAVFTEAELARSYSTIEALLKHPDVHKFAQWIKKRPIEFRDGTTSLRRRRQRGRGARMVEGLDAESDSVGPGIYGGSVLRDETGAVVIGRQFEDHNALPGPVYTGDGYTALSAAIRRGNIDEVMRLLIAEPELADEVTTGGATPLHVCGMSQAGQRCTKLLCAARDWLGCDVDARDTWGYTALQRHATNDLAEGAQALLKAGASHTIPSGLDLDANPGDSARELAYRLRSFACLKAFQQHEIRMGLPLPDGEIEL